MMKQFFLVVFVDWVRLTMFFLSLSLSICSCYTYICIYVIIIDNFSKLTKLHCRFVGCFVNYWKQNDSQKLFNHFTCFAISEDFILSSMSLIQIVPKNLMLIYLSPYLSFVAWINMVDWHIQVLLYVFSTECFQ